MGGKIHPLKYSFKLSLGASALIFVTLESSKQDDTSGYRPTNPGITAALVFDKKKTLHLVMTIAQVQLRKLFQKKKKKDSFSKRNNSVGLPPTPPRLSLPLYVLE